MTSKSKGRNLAAASKRRGAEPQRSWAAIRQDLMAGKHRLGLAPTPAAAAPKLPASLPHGVPALPAQVEAERARITALHGLASQAERMGLTGFDLNAAVASGLSASKVRTALLDDSAARSHAVGEIAAYASQSPYGTADHGGMDSARKRAAYKRGLTGKR